MKLVPMTLGVMLVSALAGCASKPKEERTTAVPKTVYNDQKTLRTYVKNWPVSSRFAVGEMIDRYGLPNAVSEGLITWNNTGYFKRSTVYRDGITHNFPTPHEDVLEQTIGYRIPSRSVGNLWEFDGSIVIDRTRGELSSRCQREEMNILALNLADNIIQDRMTVSRAREEYDASAKAFMSGDGVPTFMAGLNFSEYLNAGDPDHGIRERNPGTIQAQEAGPGDE